MANAAANDDSGWSRERTKRSGQRRRRSGVTRGTVPEYHYVQLLLGDVVHSARWCMSMHVRPSSSAKKELDEVRRGERERERAWVTSSGSLRLSLSVARAVTRLFRGVSRVTHRGPATNFGAPRGAANLIMEMRHSARSLFREVAPEGLALDVSMGPFVQNKGSVCALDGRILSPRSLTSASIVFVVVSSRDRSNRALNTRDHVGSV